MKNFGHYLKHLENLVDIAIKSPEHINYDAVNAALDGEPANALRKLIPLQKQRASGAFFTGSDLSKFALQSFVKTFSEQSVILDPACGVGDLLISCALSLPRNEDISQTLKYWEERFIGRELHQEFVSATKARLILAVLRESDVYRYDFFRICQERFPNIKAEDGLTDYNTIKSATHIVMNPPFTRVNAPANCTWAQGKVNSAALFLEACVTHAKEGTRIMAILPDVLRSGSNYQKWRERIELQTQEERIKLYGQFDKWADVDVFILELLVQKSLDNSSETRWGKAQNKTGTILVEDYFRIHVGPVVDYRDPHDGSSHPFIVSRKLPPWELIDKISTHRKFAGRVFSPPFVVVRRTSRKGDQYRAIGTVINTNKPVAVENHLLVLVPKDGDLKTCQRLLTVLKQQETTHWLDQQIRCRHLTVSSLAKIPWWRAKS